MPSRVEAFAEEFAEAVRQAFAVTYGVPNSEDKWRSVRPSWSRKSVFQGWVDPDPKVAVVGTEYAWISDPYESQEDRVLWDRTMEILKSFGWGDVRWDSVNSAVHVVYADMPAEWQSELIRQKTSGR
jgi:hypothetical protein